jgi:hypothetical protein
MTLQMTQNLLGLERGTVITQGAFQRSLALVIVDVSEEFFVQAVFPRNVPYPFPTVSTFLSLMLFPHMSTKIIFGDIGITYHAEDIMSMLFLHVQREFMRRNPFETYGALGMTRVSFHMSTNIIFGDIGITYHAEDIMSMLFLHVQREFTRRYPFETYGALGMTRVSALVGFF